MLNQQTHDKLRELIDPLVAGNFTEVQRDINCQVSGSSLIDEDVSNGVSLPCRDVHIGPERSIFYRDPIPPTRNVRRPEDYGVGRCRQCSGFCEDHAQNFVGHVGFSDNHALNKRSAFIDHMRQIGGHVLKLGYQISPLVSQSLNSLFNLSERLSDPLTAAHNLGIKLV
jgi:hypothetical protein